MAKPSVLFMTKDEELTRKFKEFFSSDRNTYKFIPFNNSEEAISILQQKKVDVLILDMDESSVFESVNLLKLLYEIKLWIPAIAVRVNGDSYNDEFKKFGIVASIENFIQGEEMIKTIQQIVDGNLKEDRISGLNLSTILQVIELEKKTCIVFVRNGYKIEEEGKIFCKDGKLEDAELGSLSGIPALEKIFEMENTLVSIKYITHMRNKLGESISKILMELAYNEDEKYRTHKGGFKMNVKKLNEAIEAQKEALGAALLSTDIVMLEDGQSIAGFNSNPKGCALFSQLTNTLIKTIKDSGLPSLGKYYLLDLVEDKMIIVIYMGDYIWGMLIDKKKAQLGLLLNIVIPKIVDAFESAIAS